MDLCTYDFLGNMEGFMVCGAQEMGREVGLRVLESPSWAPQPAHPIAVG